MLRSIKDLENYTVVASDGSVGNVKDFLFDDLTWVIRYFVVETGTWLSNRKVLISPISLQKPNWKEKTLPAQMTTDQVKNSPDIDTDKPVSRQHEMNYLDFYGYPYYWGEDCLWGVGMYPYMLYPGYTNFLYEQANPNNTHIIDDKTELEAQQNDDPNLRSCKAIIGYHIHANDGDIGHISGLLVEESTWAVRYFVVDTSSWWGKHNVLISPEWIDQVQWLDCSVSVDLSRQKIQDAPEYHSTEQLNHQHEQAIYEHYGLTGYWTREKK
ncbi:PRC-barrel domain-containing protein [Celerinatantimonas yamalensis]|uniref:PRC-barrel domain-containing protein n=1 Tax=Celerinatantimonas yamalensis TaxID=559956 RepID=A0ABW9G8J5_9GAMM